MKVKIEAINVWWLYVGAVLRATSEFDVVCLYGARAAGAESEF
jgi:hypothetical protein